MVDRKNYQPIFNFKIITMQTSLFEEQEIKSQNTWSECFSLFTQTSVDVLLKRVNFDRITKVIYPERGKVMRIFQDLQPKDIKVVILGQDPYHNGNATGYAFECKIEESPSLAKIRECLEDYCEQDIDSLNLESWVKQGVFLLNTVLTVEKGKPNSHKDIGWEQITTEAIKIINKIDRPIVFMLWGNYAIEYKKYLTNPKHLILSCTHPASASYNKTKWKCNNFECCDNFFLNLNIEQITWIQ